MSTLKVDTIRHNSATSDAITTAADGTCTAIITEVSNGQLGNRNIIINGSMMISQRSTSVSVSGTGYHALDRWKASLDLPSGVSNYTFSQETDAPTGFAASFKITPNQARSGALSASDRVFIQTKLEAQTIRASGWEYTNSSKYLTCSFYIKSNLTGVVGVEFFSGDTASSYTNYNQTVTINSADTWERKSVKIYGNSNLVFNNDNGEGLTLTLHFMDGPNFTSGTFTTGSWHDSTTANRGSSSNIDITSSASNYVSFTGVQLEVGDMTKFEHRSYDEELSRCQRYCQKYHPNGNTYRFLCQGNVDNDGNNLAMFLPFIKEFRDEPTMTTTGSASDYAVRRDTTQTCTSVPVAGTTSTMSTGITFTKSSHGWATGQSVKAFFKTAGSYLIFSAEI